MYKSIEILAAAAGREALAAGQKVTVKLDYCLLNDDPSINWLDEFGPDVTLFDPEKVVIIIDHQNAPCYVSDAQRNYKILSFARDHGAEFSQSGGVGYELMRRHYLKSGQLVAACGSHFSYMGASGALAIKLTAAQMADAVKTGFTEVTVPEVVQVKLEGKLPYGSDMKDAAIVMLGQIGRDGFAGKAVEFCGDAAEHERSVLCAFAADAGAFSAIFVDELCDACCVKLNLSEVEAMIALPGSPFLSKKVREMPYLSVQSVYVGGCISGNIDSLRLFAELMKGKHCHRGVRVMFSAADTDTFKQALNEGIVDALLSSGAQLINCGCSGCRTNSFGYTDENENLISAGANNYPGCAGAQEANVYLTSIRAAAGSALTGMLTLI